MYIMADSCPVGETMMNISGFVYLLIANSKDIQAEEIKDISSYSIISI